MENQLGRHVVLLAKGENLCVDDETAREIEKLVQNLDRKLQMEHRGDVFPSQNAMIIKEQGNHLAAEQMKWVFQGSRKESC